MAASGFGREAGPSYRGPGSAVPAFGAGAATTPAPLSATSPFPSVRPASPLGPPTAPFSSARPATHLGASTSPFPSVRPANPLGPSTAPFSSARPATPLASSTSPFASVRPANPFRAAAPRFPSPRPQFTPANATPRPATTPQSPPVATPSTRPAAGPGPNASARLSSSRPALDPGVSAATGRQVARHLQPQPRTSSPSVSSHVDPFISAKSKGSSTLSNPRAGSPTDYDNGMGKRRLVDYTDTFIGGENVETSKRMRSPSSEFALTIKSPPPDIRENIRSPADFGGSNAANSLRTNADLQKSVVSHPKFGNQTQSRIGVAHSPSPQMSNSHSNGLNTPAVSPPKPSSAAKRIASPLDASDDGRAIPLTELEREEEAKAKRLARFHIELSRPVENTNDYVKALKGPADKPKQARVSNISVMSNDNTDERMDDMDSPELAPIVGLCPDMCPESERAERERKGDLDRYERLDGDRNQTTDLLAVKKYNRTAERDADLIRPLAVLQKTMDYLLNLLDHTYDDSFLGLYNFLWDRMRAIRMDLRMQHFFNQDAISMLEQMIRLHIIAMHELCEYNKGEGFSEGFDAHLNIEQMNKTSVELFQMYDDHRRKGVLFPSEQEFRGYYALLKLDKHPGYKVEPAELSLDLAKMSREIRGSPEILFARKVARACRMGNFIAFFRLARKATYLQACLMHAHFAKLRRQALASLHSGLQNGQGVPISHAVEWLAMEDEDIESLLEYHGFGLRQYEELYLVKEGPFLNSESDFPSGCSQLVHSKKSQKIIDDVSSGPVCAPASKKDTAILYSGRLATGKRDLFSPQHLVIPADGTGEFGLPFSRPVSPTPSRQVTRQNSVSLSPKAGSFTSTYSSPCPTVVSIKDSVSFFPTTSSPRASRVEMFSKTPKVASPNAKSNTSFVEDIVTEDQTGSFTGFSQKLEMQAGIPWSEANTKPDTFEEPTVSHPYANSVSLDYSNMNGEEVEFRESGFDTGVDMDEGTPPYHEVPFIKPGSPTGTHLSDNEEYGDHDIRNGTADDQLVIVMSQKTKISDERLTRILRKWRQRAADKRFLREQKNALAVAALSSLSLGPPVYNTTAVPRLAIQELDIGHALRERHARQQRSWSQLNVSELSGPILLERNPDASCLCWKLLLLVPPGSMESLTNNLTSKWLLRKLMGSENEDGGLIFSSAGLSIWSEWISSSTCCLSIVRASDQQVISDDITDSTSCIIFVVSEKISWEEQKVRFSSLLASIPAQSNLPLLILSGDTYNEGHEYVSQYIFERLGLNDLSGEKISSSFVVFLVENYMEGHGNGFFDDDNLRGGLKWLTSKLPPQLDVTLVKTHELLLDFLNLQPLSRHGTSEVGPGDCISVFNNAVNQLAEQVLVAAHTNSNGWPAREIDHLETSSNERIFAETFLPRTGWSSPSRIQPLLAAINSCKLPDFSYDLSWLNQGSLMGKHIQDQKLLLEECLAGYLTETARLLNEIQVATEVNVMVQKHVSLELRDSYYYLVPRWMSIFRRIYNWRLAKFSTGELSEAYVLSQHLYQASAAESKDATEHRLTADANTTSVSFLLEDDRTVSTGLYLDEVIEISCDLDVVDVCPASPLPPPLPIQVHEEPPAPAETIGEDRVVHSVINDEMYVRRKVNLSKFMPLEKDAKLARLLEECSNLQDRIDETLYIYF